MTDVQVQVQNILLPKEEVTLDDVERFGQGVGQIASAAVEIDANRDGEISPQEWLGLGLVFFNQALANFGSLSGLSLVMTPEGRDAVRTGFASGFDLQDDAKEAVIEGWINWIDATLDQYEATLAAFKPAA